ncbi:hypothetical protein A2U01_0055224, partial [Trifolium medium]|nr:hypothetical protein [Trifolium medium]
DELKSIVELSIIKKKKREVRSWQPSPAQKI